MAAAAPETRYARSDGLNIAYQVVGHGDIDLLLVPGWISHIEHQWEVDQIAEFLRRLGTFSRLILFDKRGTGMSDRPPNDSYPTLEQRMDDVRAVLDAVGSEGAALFGMSEGGPMSILFAATYPERCRGLILCGSYAYWVNEPGYPWAPTREQHLIAMDVVEKTWGKGAGLLNIVAPSVLNDKRLLEQMTEYLRRATSPGAAVSLYRQNIEIDVREVLPLVQTPTLIVHQKGDQLVNVGCGRYLAERIANSREVELDGMDHLPFFGDSAKIVAEVEEFLTGARTARPAERVLATVLFTDIVGSTEMASRLGDEKWKSVLQSHNELSRRYLAEFGGREVKTTGDGLMATFDGPGRGIRCAQSIASEAGKLGFELRAGLHTGEVEIMGEDIGGIAVHIASRVSSMAGAGEVLVSRTVKDLVVGSGIEFESQGTKELKGVPGEWELFAARG